MKTISVTDSKAGKILVVEGEYGLLETVVNGKYGFIGVSSSYGCGMTCKGCSLPSMKRGLNATFDDIIGQVNAATEVYPEIKTMVSPYIKFSHIGEPTFNPYILIAADEFKNMLIRPRNLINSVLPSQYTRNHNLLKFMGHCIKRPDMYININVYSTDEAQRREFLGDRVLTLEQIQETMNNDNQKIYLTFLMDKIVDVEKIASIFNNNKFSIRLINPIGCDKEAFDTKVQEFADKGFDIDIAAFTMPEEELIGGCGNMMCQSVLPIMSIKN